MADRTFTNSASALWLGLAISLAPALASNALSASSAPLAMVEPSRPAPTIFDQALRDQSSGDAQDDYALPAELRRQMVAYPTQEAPGTIVIDTPHTYLYYVLGGGRAMRYAIGVGREGFTWSGVQKVSRKAEWPDWVPPAEMIKRQQYLPRWVAGGPGNPLGARAMYLGDTEYRIHGTNDPTTIGKKVSSGCVRLTNEDVVDLYSRTNLGSKVIVLPDASQRLRSENVAPTDDRQMVSRQAVSPQALSPQALSPARSSGRTPVTPGPVASAFGLY
jgi:lipoprotein-anchoring transpeptidase ErfK/SrfK